MIVLINSAVEEFTKYIRTGIDFHWIFVDWENAATEQEWSSDKNQQIVPERMRAISKLVAGKEASWFNWCSWRNVSQVGRELQSSGYRIVPMTQVNMYKKGKPEEKDLVLGSDAILVAEGNTKLMRQTTLTLGESPLAHHNLLLVSEPPRVTGRD